MNATSALHLTSVFHSPPSREHHCCSIFYRTWTAYQTAVKHLVNFLFRHDWFVTGMVLGALLSEPLTAIRSGIRSLFWNKKNFTYYGMNPKKLAPSAKNPILLLHGNYHNQTGWLDLAKRLQKEEPDRPVFTINLPSGDITEKDEEFVKKKIEEIKALYSEKIQIDLIGHSRGSEVASLVQLDSHRNKKSDIGKVIHLGNFTDDILWRLTPNFQKLLKSTFEILGRWDLFVPLPLYSSLLSAHRVEVDYGHVGMLYARETHDRILEALRA